MRLRKEVKRYDELYKDESGRNQQRIRIHKAQPNEMNKQRGGKVSDENDESGGVRE